MAIVNIPSLVQDVTGGVERVVVPGETIRHVIDSLELQFPGIRDRICENGRLRPHVAVWVDGEPVRGLIEPVGADSEIHFLPAISGG